jgi:hypothetical protein
MYVTVNLLADPTLREIRPPAASATASVPLTDGE